MLAGGGRGWHKENLQINVAREQKVLLLKSHASRFRLLAIFKGLQNDLRFFFFHNLLQSSQERRSEK